MGRKFFKGFTLSEMLIAITIVGIVVAIVTPAIVNNFAKKGYEVSINKTYIELDTALSNLEVNTYGHKLSKSILNKKAMDPLLTESAKKFLDDYFYVKIYCGLISNKCFASTYKSIDDPRTPVPFVCTGGYSAIINGGAALCIVPKKDEPTIIQIDTNGKDGPNIGGRDAFVVQVNDNFEISDTGTEDECTSSALGKGCFSNVMNNNWVINY